jgi:hypothetical protein
MTISEMIEQLTELKAQHGDIEVVLNVTDHTDWDYNFEHPGFDVENVYDEDGDYDDETDYCVCSIQI